MKSDLDLIIDHLIEEKKYLLGEIEKCVSLYDYSSAQFFSDAIITINYKLKILESLSPFHPFKKEEIESLIIYWEKKIRREELNENQIQRAINIKRFQQKIDFLKNQLKKNKIAHSKTFIDSPTIDDAIFELLEKEYAILRFHLLSRFNSDLDLKIILENQIQFSFSTKDKSKRPFWKDYFVDRPLKKIGFVENKKMENLEFEITINENSFFEIKELLARLFFEIILSPRELKEQFYIEKIDNISPSPTIHE